MNSIVTSATELADIARIALKAHPDDFNRARLLFANTICAQRANNPQLLVELFANSDHAVRCRALEVFPDLAQNLPAPAGGVGQLQAADKATAEAPTPNTPDAEGHPGAAGTGLSWHADRVAPSRQPQPAARGPTLSQIAATLSERRHIAELTLFDSFKVHDGRPIGDVRFGSDMERVRQSSAQAAYVLRQIQRHVQAPDGTAIREAVRLDYLERIVQKGAEFSDA